MQSSLRARRPRTVQINGAILAAALLVATSVWLPAPAEAAIQCNGAYQINASGEVRTPYCEDMQLVQVARSYGRAVTFASIRRSLAAKTKLCKFLRNEIRVHATCQPVYRQRLCNGSSCTTY